ncbi:MAG: UDP-glucose 4-epimerase, partial [Candidatus Atribacteria bacterium]|nr:UDP-glucose 4-epimerase [Candidatus Atribacteria bacterium]
TINGDGEYIRDYVYVEDVAFACLLSIQNMLKLSRLRKGQSWPGSFCAFNTGTGVGSSVNQLYRLLQDLLDRHSEAHYGPPRPGDLRKNILNCQAAKEMLNWGAKNDLKSGLAKTVEWFTRKN